MSSRTLRRKQERARRKKRQLALVIAVAGALLIGLGVLLALGGGSDNQNDVTLQTLDGQTVHLSDYEGQVVLLNFWASWCPPCRAEMPTLDAYYREHRDEGFVVLAVNVGESPALARAFIEEQGFSFPVALDEDTHIADQFGVRGLPVSLLIDRQGNISYRHEGLITADVLEAQLIPLLEGGG